MVYSSKKPYQKPSKRSTRFLSQGIGPESVFEKPYLQSEYTEMNQAPNTPGVPRGIGGSGELKCLYDPNECEITIGCYAGPGIKIIGGPEESGAGYLTPEIIEGAIASWTVQSDVRAIEIIVDPNMSENVVRVVFVDGWGKKYEKLVNVDCSVDTVFRPLVRQDTVNWEQIDSPSSEYYSTGGSLQKNIGCTGSFFGDDQLFEVCIRFPSIDLNQGDTPIATLSLYNNVTYTTTPTFRIHGLNEDNGDTPSDLSEWHTDVASNLTTNFTDWNPASNSPAAETWIDLDVTDIITEIVDRLGWSYNNAIVLFIRNNGYTVGDYRNVNTLLYSGVNLRAPKLIMS